MEIARRNATAQVEPETVEEHLKVLHTVCSEMIYGHIKISPRWWIHSRGLREACLHIQDRDRSDVPPSVNGPWVDIYNRVLDIAIQALVSEIDRVDKNGSRAFRFDEYREGERAIAFYSLISKLTDWFLCLHSHADDDDCFFGPELQRCAERALEIAESGS